MRARLAKVPGETTREAQSLPSEAQSVPSDAQLRKMIEEAAYYRAEKRGFAPGLEAQDWCKAEAEIQAHMRALQSRI